MKKKDVHVGQLYRAKVSGKDAVVKIQSEHPAGGWFGVNVRTGRQVRLRTAGRLRNRVFEKCSEHLGLQWDKALDCRECFKRRRAALERDVGQAVAAVGRYQVVNTWNGGEGGRKVVFTSTHGGDEGHNECFEWIIEHTPFSFAEATKNQGYTVERVPDLAQGLQE